MSLNFWLNGDGVNCNTEYLEILDGDSGDAISVGKYVSLLFLDSIGIHHKTSKTQPSHFISGSVGTRHLEPSPPRLLRSRWVVFWFLPTRHGARAKLLLCTSMCVRFIQCVRRRI